MGYSCAEPKVDQTLIILLFKNIAHLWEHINQKYYNNSIRSLRDHKKNTVRIRTRWYVYVYPSNILLCMTSKKKKKKKKKKITKYDSASTVLCTFF